jgi:hypothetical protein
MGRRPNGMWWLSGEIDDERARALDDRLRARARKLAGDQPITPNHLAQALCDLVAGAGDSPDSARMGVGYIVDAATLFDHDGGGCGRNLVPISSAWHHRIHDRGWILIMGADRSLELRRPAGTLPRRLPPPTPVTRRQHE